MGLCDARSWAPLGLCLEHFVLSPCRPLREIAPPPTMNLQAALPPHTPCPCRAREDTAMPYSQCCGPWHQGLAEGQHAPDPESLMRSRYTAYALAQPGVRAGPAMVAYLLATWHPATAPGELEPQVVKWTGLEVLEHQHAGDAGLVHFVAHHKVNGRAQKLEETSRFVRVNGAWLYVDAMVPEGP